MSPAEILSRFEREGPAAVDRPSGHAKSLRAIFDWTYSLLEPDQRTVLAAVARCPSFDLELAEGLVPEVDVAQALDGLVAVSLVRSAPSRTGQTRFRVFETIRQELARRTPASDRDTFLARHAAAMLAKATALARVIDEKSPRWAYDQLEDEVDNARQAVDTLQAIDPSMGVRLWRELRHLWQRPSRVHEGLARLARLEAAGDVRDEDLCAALVEALELTEEAGGFGAGLEILARGLAVAERIGDRHAQMWHLDQRTRIHAHLGEAHAAEADYARVAALGASESDDTVAYLIAAARMFLTSMGSRFDDAAIAAANAAYMTSVTGASMRFQLLKEGTVAMFQVNGQRYAAALAGIDRVLARRDDAGPDGLYIGDSDLIWTLHVRILALAGLGRFEEAKAQLLEGVALCPAEPPLQDVSVLLAAAQLVAAGLGHLELCARLFGWLDHGRRLDIPDREVALKVLRTVRRKLGETAVELAIRDGAAADPMALLRSLPEVLAGSSRSTARESKRHGDLTRREVEIAELVAQGKSNREIAEVLFISPKTASVHVGNLKEKLGASTRLELALRAREMGLGAMTERAL